MKVAIVFLTKKTQPGTIDFAGKIHRETNYDTFIVSDEEEDMKGASSRNCYMENDVVEIRQRAAFCVERGFCKSNEGSTNIKSDCIALDKFLYLFSEKDYDFVWVFEDDVFIPSVECVVNLHKKYSAPGNADLVTGRHNKRLPGENYWHWPLIDGLTSFSKEYHHYSMICAMGISKKMLNVVSKWAKDNRRLLFCEVMFNTLAEVNKLKAVQAEELRSVVWMGDWRIDDFINLPYNLFHPVKEINLHRNKRQLVSELKSHGYIPTKPIPDFLKHE